MAPDVLPVTAMLSVWAPLLGALMQRATKLLIERGSRYDRWLREREAGNN